MAVAALARVSIPTPRGISIQADVPRIYLSQAKPPSLLPTLGGRSSMIARWPRRRLVLAASSPSTPSRISEKVEESIRKAEETCAENAESGECVAAWDEVEELSAAASHARDKAKTSSDPLETYCKDNPETDECRTYDS